MPASGKSRKSSVFPHEAFPGEALQRTMKPKVQAPPTVDVSMEDVHEILERARKLGLSEKDTELLRAIAESYAFVLGEIGDKDTTIRRLRKLIFGPKTEKTKDVVGKGAEPETGAETPPSDDGAAEKPRKKRKGHGRIGAEAYTGAERVKVPHESLGHGDACPSCRGKLYRQKKPALLVRITASVPFPAKVYEKERLRCNGCGEIYTAKSPDGVGEERFDGSVASMVALLRYGTGLPFHRLQELQVSLGVPFPAAAQWELVRDAAKLFEASYEELVRQAAQGEVLYNDDTPMRILECFKENKERKQRGEKLERTGTFTSGVVAEAAGQRIVLYFTGRRHAGENLAQVLAERASGLDPPLQMCDGLDRNLPGELQTIVSNCLVHGRRHFVDVVESFPAEVRHVLEELAQVYRNDARARTEGMSPEERLRLHQEESGPVMDQLKAWMDALIAEKKVEPNSGLGQAIAYLQKRWERMTVFLRMPGAPLDNSLCERMLKRAILHRKNSLFYKTENGARVGDLFMSLIATARLANVNPFDYLTELQRHADEVAANPSAWVPWNYPETLASASQPT